MPSRGANNRYMQAAALGCGLVILAALTMADTPTPEPSKLDATAQWAEFTSFTYEGHDPVFDKTPPSADQFCNPILAGFYPDPSICRVGNDFYLVNSSFSYFPGVPIFHSTDLVHWKQLGHVLDRPSQLNLDGLPVSSGIFAPAIYHHDGVFYMITTNVRGIGNFYVTATNPAGPWSEPIALKFEGIDPSFFFDDDGHAYIVHNGAPPDNKPLYDGHRAIWLWDFDAATHEVKNGRIIVNGGVDLTKKPVWIEGPHVFKRNGFYYLCAAEGGTSVNHSQVIFRTRSLDEPFVPWSGNPLLTQRSLDPRRPDPVTSTGHAQLFDTPTGDWWAVFLAVRPYERNHYNTGRETFLLPVTWTSDGWPVILKPGEPVPRVAARPALPASPSQPQPTTGSFTWRDEFDGDRLGLDWCVLRTPREQWWSLTAKPGSLLISPRSPALNSVNRKDTKLNANPSFIARRQQHINFSATTTLVANPSLVASESGLAALQNDTSYLFLGVKVDGGKAREIFLERHVKASQEILARAPLAVDSGPLELKIEAAGKDYRFSYRASNTSAGTVLIDKVDGSILSSESAGGFVGTMIGVYSRQPIEATTQPRPK